MPKDIAPIYAFEQWQLPLVDPSVRVAVVENPIDVASEYLPYEILHTKQDKFIAWIPLARTGYQYIHGAHISDVTSLSGFGAVWLLVLSRI
jgi:hypothetical protein